MDRDISTQGDSGGLYNDDGAIELFKTDGSHKEFMDNSNRYKQAFEDIVQRHFVQQSGELPEEQIVLLTSQSDGITPFLEHFGSTEGVNNPCYCYTAAIELENTGDGKYKVNDISVVH